MWLISPLQVKMGLHVGDFKNQEVKPYLMLIDFTLILD